MGPGRVVFAWLPVRLYENRDRCWEPTGRWAWLRKVWRVRTIWGETFHVQDTPA